MEKPTPSTASRRAFFRFAAATVASVPALRAGPQKATRNSELSEPPRELKLVKELKNAYLRALSPDGGKMCVYFTRHPNMTFTLRPGEKVRVEKGNPKEQELTVIQLGSWDAVYSDRQRRAPPGGISFFAESEAFYEETVSSILTDGFSAISQVVVNWKTGERVERTRSRSSDELSYFALGTNTLLGMDTSTAPFRHNVLTKAVLPDYVEVARVPFAVPDGEKQDGHETSPFISANRQIFAYAFGHTIVCRRTEGFTVLWTQPIEKEFFGTRRLTVSANGSRVAVAVIDTTLWEYQRRFYVSIYHGEDGREIVKLPVNGDQGVAVSPDGKLLAVGKRLAKSGDIQLLMEIYDIPSRRLVATGTHDRVPPGRFQNLNGVFDNDDGLQFTSDGKYLVTSGNNRVKVWEI